MVEEAEVLPIGVVLARRGVVHAKLILLEVLSGAQIFDVISVALVVADINSVAKQL